MLNVLTGVALALLVSSLVAVFTTRSARRRGFEEGRRQAIEEFRREQDAAVHLFLSRLTNLITRPCEEAAIPARAESILELIRSYQDALAGLVAPLTPQIDQVRKALAALDEDLDRSNTRDEIRAAFSALRADWPRRKQEIETQLRNLLGQLTTIETPDDRGC